MLRVTTRVRRELDERLQAEHGLTMAEYDALVLLADRPDRRMRMADLADQILQPRSSLTRIVDRLERNGLVRRDRPPEDGRGAHAVLTDFGADIFRAAQRSHHDNVRELFLDRLGDAQLRALARTWEALGEPDP
jgi:DNA-binding MarR family transcriptional regulator